jgi:hypothetical protein
VTDAPIGAVVDPVAWVAAPQVLPSERLARLAELAATALERAETASPVLLSDRALKDVLVAVDASTAPNTKKAYRSDIGTASPRGPGPAGTPPCRHRGRWSRTT